MEQYHDRHGNRYTRIVEVDPSTEEPVGIEYLVRNREGQDMGYISQTQFQSMLREDNGNY